MKYLERSSGMSRTGREKEQSCKKNIHFIQRALSLIKIDLHYSLKYVLEVHKDLGEG